MFQEYVELSGIYRYFAVYNHYLPGNELIFHPKAVKKMSFHSHCWDMLNFREGNWKVGDFC